ncbi:hypothetical protein FH968_01835 [Buttiauxella sp. B2]|uniref:conserved phage C-terminal domain-containing protein n=1 Tax=Buttiauxella sp. B2 TaxID=2587812 RepID=UPI00111F1853|nr:hypothetical protein FH968_01835 [Buttiauxella sp. B2]
MGKYVADELTLVIDHRAELWVKDFKISRYLCPKTRFSFERFEGYRPLARKRFLGSSVNILKKASLKLQHVIPRPRQTSKICPRTLPNVFGTSSGKKIPSASTTTKKLTWPASDSGENDENSIGSTESSFSGHTSG